MLTNLRISVDEQRERIVAPLPMSAVYNKQQFVSQFASLHHESTQPTLVSQLLTTALPNVISEFWILYDDHHRPLACAAANTVMSDTSVGYVGLLEAKTEQAGTAVLKAATEWLKKGGLRQFKPVRQILGPVNLTSWLQYRLRVDNDPLPSMSFEPRHPEFYQACFSQAGFVKAADYYSTFNEIDTFLNGFIDYTCNQSIEDAGFIMQPWNTLDFPASLTPERHPELTPQDDVAKRVYDLSIEMFRGKELFDDGLTRQHHRLIVLNDMVSRPEVDNASLMDLSSFVVDRHNGRDVGYLACWVENHDTLVLKTIGFIEKIRKTKAFAIGVRETVQRAKQHWGCTKVACALMNGNTVQINERITGKGIRHVYRLYIHQPSAPAAQNEQEYHQHPVYNQAVETPARLTQPTPPIRTKQLAVKVSPTAATDEGNCDYLQKRERDMRSQMYWDQQRLKCLAQRSRGRALARL
ncbi:hypothetical protein BGZ99_005868 [Dissophora globulifera]|uniref:N-acetyltransferase domain-containing protein n=1 Tax=Dissophora globulifera TaxID=979702 RepID=A0A9P6RU51_9FUNG|nr:hypothetical protein BGZ99_005868 [Dissophora globulifera]